jgi:hypothetical protein
MITIIQLTAFGCNLTIHYDKVNIFSNERVIRSYYFSALEKRICPKKNFILVQQFTASYTNVTGKLYHIIIII